MSDVEKPTIKENGGDKEAGPSKRREEDVKTRDGGSRPYTPPPKKLKTGKGGEEEERGDVPSENRASRGQDEPRQPSFVSRISEGAASGDEQKLQRPSRSTPPPPGQEQTGAAARTKIKALKNRMRMHGMQGGTSTCSTADTEKEDPKKGDMTALSKDSQAADHPGRMSPLYGSSKGGQAEGFRPRAAGHWKDPRAEREDEGSPSKDVLMREAKHGPPQRQVSREGLLANIAQAQGGGGGGRAPPREISREELLAMVRAPPGESHPAAGALLCHEAEERTGGGGPRRPLPRRESSRDELRGPPRRRASKEDILRASLQRGEGDPPVRHPSPKDEDSPLATALAKVAAAKRDTNGGLKKPQPQPQSPAGSKDPYAVPSKPRGPGRPPGSKNQPKGDKGPRKAPGRRSSSGTLAAAPQHQAPQRPSAFFSYGGGGTSMQGEEGGEGPSLSAAIMQAAGAAAAASRDATSAGEEGAKGRQGAAQHVLQALQQQQVCWQVRHIPSPCRHPGSPPFLFLLFLLLPLPLRPELF